ncbi:phosphatase PAP2 family protein [Acinetobacter sp. B5B]|uniref:phosphatase PAP2 family protein n=1 Tax=Acinetobacter baretiae TaxID=2605383 RepID=UPI0018C22178|nr:phosphatase PAP2 family protein [Acinetobacter baretiae]MBF7682577.1 phosphatase PAP2 family protein [Acinetobacter baretiae]
MPNHGLTTFDAINLCLLGICCIVLNFFIPVAGHVDQVLSAPWVNALGQYSYRDNPYLISLGHDGLKYIVICVAVAHLMVFLYLKVTKKNPVLQKICLMVLLSMVCSVSCIAVLKSTSEHACPWSMVSTHLGMIQWSQDIHTSAKCFPGGHASGGFSLIILFFAYRIDYPKIARTGLIFALTLGCLMSLVQMMRGAHFLSHNLWSLWWSWLIALVVYKLFLTFSLGVKSVSSLQYS